MNLNSEDILKLKNSAVDLAFDAIAFTDINMKINYVNQSFVKLFEFESADEIINKKTVFDFTDAENWTDEQMRNIIENIRQKGFYKFETKCATQKNKILKLQVNSSLLKTDKQEILGFVGIFHNVTDLENYYNSLLESEQKFKIIVDNVNEIVWLKDELAEKIIYVNKKYEEIYGKSIQSLYADAMSFMDKVFPADAEKIFKAYRRFLETGEIFIEQGRIYGPNNEIKWLEVKLVAIKDEDGRIVKSVGIAKDITDLKESIEKLDSQNQQLRAIEQQLRASNQQLLAVNQQLTASEQQLRAMNQQLHAKEENLKKQNAELLQLNKKLQQSETKYKNLIENMNEGLWVIDAQAKTIFVNPKLQEILGYKAEEMLGKTPFDFMPESKKEDSENKLKTERRTGQGQHFETEFIKKNGEIVIVLMNTTPLFEDGKYAGAMAAMIDITERKNLEKQFLESEKSATVGQLAAGVAHEFNNLLTMIFNNIQLLQTDEYKNSQELLKEIENTVRRGAGIVSNLMAFAKPNKPNKDIVKIERLVNDIINIQKYYMTLENIEVDTHFENTEEVFVDTTQIQHLLLNLFINARHAILPKNRGKIKVKTFSDKDKVVIIIEDTGIGIKNEDLSKIFLPFFSTKGVWHKDSEYSKYNIEGSGLGLSVASTIIKNHNGEIKVESKEGKWTRFIIALPSARKEIPDVYASNREDHRKKIFDKKTLKVLVVDDEEIILKSMSRILKIYNCDAVCVLDGRKGIELARTEKFDLIILDLLLPEITGEKIFKEIREFDKDTPIIFISGQINLEVEKLKKIGAFDVIQKPFDMEELHIVLENLRNFMDERNQRVGIFTQMRK